MKVGIVGHTVDEGFGHTFKLNRYPSDGSTSTVLASSLPNFKSRVSGGGPAYYNENFNINSSAIQAGNLVVEVVSVEDGENFSDETAKFRMSLRMMNYKLYSLLK